MNSPLDHTQLQAATAAQAQEDKYALPYHWFPQSRLPRFARLQKERIVFDMIRQNAPGPVRRHLDVGCGDGRWTSVLQDYLCHSPVGSPEGVETVGIDISKRAVGFARLICPHLEFLTFAGDVLPFEDRSFDLVTSIEVIEHIPSDTERLHLLEAFRVLRPGGLLVLTTPSRLLPMPPQHLRHYTVDGLTDLIRSCDLEVLSVRGQSSPYASRFRRLRKRMNRVPMIWKVWRPFLSERSPERATSLLVAARRPPQVGA